MVLRSRLTLVVVFLSSLVCGQDSHVHEAPEQLGQVSFAISCTSDVQQEFNRGVALLHSFAYTAAQEAFRHVAGGDPHCAMAHWGIAMTNFHQLWEPPIRATATAAAQQEIDTAVRIGSGTERERGFIRAATVIFHHANTIPYATRVANYERAMAEVAAQNKTDVESQVFYALALLSDASRSDKTHAHQKQAADLLEPLFRVYSHHPGIPHYLIHAYDNAELAPRGLTAARDYARIAPSAPHALHMPSHIFTRLGLWQDSISSNTAARDAAHRAGDTGEELHAMDYLVYAFLQTGRDLDAAKVIHDLRAMPTLDTTDFKIGYAATAIPIRYLLERQQWAEAASVVPCTPTPPHVTAIAIWARGIGLARSGHPDDASRSVRDLHAIELQLQATGDAYWSAQVRIMRREVMAWSAQGQNKQDDAVALMRLAAEEEDSIEKLPVTPGPIIPAREQLGQLLLEQRRPGLAVREFQTALANAPGRLGSARGAAKAAQRSGPKSIR